MLWETTSFTEAILPPLIPCGPGTDCGLSQRQYPDIRRLDPAAGDPVVLQLSAEDGTMSALAGVAEAKGRGIGRELKTDRVEGTVFGKACALRVTEIAVPAQGFIVAGKVRDATTAGETVS